MKDFYGTIEIMRNVSKKVGRIYLEVSSITHNRCDGFTREGPKEDTKFSVNWSPDKFLFIERDTENSTLVNWSPDKFLFVEMNTEDLALVEAFAKNIGHRPLCRYISESGLPVFEWVKQDPVERFAELENSEKKGRITELQKI